MSYPRVSAIGFSGRVQGISECVRQSAHDARSSCSNIHERLTGLFQPLHLRGARILTREAPLSMVGGGSLSLASPLDLCSPSAMP
jgi:hypothetical protein